MVQWMPVEETKMTTPVIDSDSKRHKQCLFTIGQENAIAQAYAAGEHVTLLAEKNRCNISTVCEIVKRCGVKIRPFRESHAQSIAKNAEARRKLSAAQRRDAADMYLKGMPTPAIADILGVRGGCVAQAIVEDGICLRDKYNRGRKYRLNQRFFQAINTEAKAWALGLIATDGSVHGETNQVVVTLQRQDRDALELLRATLGSDSPIRDYETSSDPPRMVSSFIVNSKLMVEDLAKYSITPNKTFTVEPWDGPDRLLAAYWRGAVDGDGSIYYTKDRKWCVSYCGRFVMVEAFRRFVTRFVATNAAIHPQVNIFQISFRGSALPQSVAKLLYDGATVFLKRKKNLADKIMAITPKYAHPRRFAR
jgi:hypothetical protein